MTNWPKIRSIFLQKYNLNLSDEDQADYETRVVKPTFVQTTFLEIMAACILIPLAYAFATNKNAASQQSEGIALVIVFVFFACWVNTRLPYEQKVFVGFIQQKRTSAITLQTIAQPSTGNVQNAALPKTMVPEPQIIPKASFSEPRALAGVYCPQCGQVIPINSNPCPKCGSILFWDNTDESSNNTDEI
jgi:hypothetical protein